MIIHLKPTINFNNNQNKRLYQFNVHFFFIYSRIIGLVSANYITLFAPHLTGGWHVSPPPFCYRYQKDSKSPDHKLARSHMQYASFVFWGNTWRHFACISAKEIGGRLKKGGQNWFGPAPLLATLLRHIQNEHEAKVRHHPLCACHSRRRREVTKCFFSHRHRPKLHNLKKKKEKKRKK